MYEISKELQKRGIFVSGIVYPAVRTKEARLRVSILATHEKWQLDHLVDSLNEINKFSMSQIGDFNFKRYIPKTCKGHQIPIVLSERQLTDFLNINIEEFTTEKFKGENVELFYDFSCFLLHSFLAPCDAVYLHESNITNRNSIQIKRRKTFKQAEIPISERMSKIIKNIKAYHLMATYFQ